MGQGAVLFLKIKMEQLLVLVAGLALTVIWAGLYLHKPALLTHLENKIHDTLTVNRGEVARSPVPVIIDLDEKSLARYGQWPWPRYRVARLLDKLGQAGAACVALDIVFAEPDRTSLVNVKQNLLHDLGADLSLQGIPQAVRDNDELLAQALAKGKVVLGYEFIFNQGAMVANRDARLHPVAAVMITPPGKPAEPAPFFTARGALTNLPRLSLAAGSSGFFNVTPDPDGILRRVPLLIRYGQRLYPSLALAAILHEMKTRQVMIRQIPGGGVRIKLGKRVIPLDQQGNLILRFHGKRHTFDYISAADLLDDQVEPARVKGKIAFVGTSAMGLAEMRTTAFDPVFPGVEVHATVVDNLLRSDWVFRPSHAREWELGVTILLGAAFSILLAWSGAGWSVLVLGGVGLGLWQGSDYLLREQGRLLSPLFPMLAAAGNFAALVALRFWLEQRRANRRTAAMLRAQNLTLQCLASLAETRDNETGAHIQRTQEYVRILCHQLAGHARFKDYLRGHAIDMLYKSAPLHDIGKVGVADEILLKPGPLTAAEFEQMKLHTVYGRDAIMNAEKRSGDTSKNSFLHYAKEVVYSHHERWDGGGYPEGLKGEAISIAGRIMALADVYDALISKRVYREALPHDQVREIIVAGSGSQFDPAIVEAFLQCEQEFQATASRISDSPEE